MALSMAQKAALAEDLADFIADEKIRAQNRIRKCETFLTKLKLPLELEGKNSEREALNSLVRNAEDDYGTLLHLERLLNMRDNRIQDQKKPQKPHQPQASNDDYGDFHQDGQGFIMGGSGLDKTVSSSHRLHCDTVY